MFRILRQATVGDRPVQHYVHRSGDVVTFRNYFAAERERARLKKRESPAVKFTIVGTKTEPTRH